MGASVVAKKTPNSPDDEIIENLEVLMNLDTLEQAEVWEEVINLSELRDESFKADAAEEKEN